MSPACLFPAAKKMLLRHLTPAFGTPSPFNGEGPHGVRGVRFLKGGIRQLAEGGEVIRG